MSSATLKRWMLKFRKDAEADNFGLFRAHLHRLGLPDEPELLLAGTIDVVIASAAYASLDKQSFGAFLKLQRYDPSKATDAKYALTFDLCGKAFGRVLVTKQADILDLADLYGHPWEDYKVCGYHSFSITRTDNKKLSSRELTRLEKEVTYDLRFDYTEEELYLWFDDQAIEGVLQVGVQDREGEVRRRKLKTKSRAVRQGTH